MKKISNKEKKEKYIETFNNIFSVPSRFLSTFSITCQNLCRSRFCPKYYCANFVVKDLLFFHLQFLRSGNIYMETYPLLLYATSGINK